MNNTIKVNLPGVKMIAHAGLAGLEPENTHAGFVAAGNRTYFGVETDVQRTADGRYLIIHDDDTEQLAGVKYIVAETDFETLRTIRMKDLDGNPRGDLVFPELSEYVNLCKKYDKNCVLEIKNHLEPDDIDGIIQVIRDCGWLEHTIFISFDLPNCECIRERLPEQRIQYLTIEFGDDLLDILIKNHFDLDIYYKKISEAHIKRCHENGILVNVWTVDDPQDAKRLAEWGVDFITSDILE